MSTRVGRLDQTVPTTKFDLLVLLVLGQAYGPECVGDGLDFPLPVHRWR